MTFENQKKTFLAKLDQSKKGSIDEQAKEVISIVNSLKDYYTTSSCSGRVYFWQGDGKKNNTEWLKVSHELINLDFFEISSQEMVWLRYEGFIIHIACRDLDKANELLSNVQKLYKKSCILSMSNKIIVEIRDSNFIEMPFYQSNLLFTGSLEWLKEEINQKLKKNWEKISLLTSLLKQ